jgi:hypothetical protein
MIFNKLHPPGEPAPASSALLRASILQLSRAPKRIRTRSPNRFRTVSGMDTRLVMKVFARTSALLIFAALCVSPGFAQDGPPAGGAREQDGGQGVAAAFAEHGVRGTVTAITGDNITVKTEEGASYKIETGANTRFRKQRDQIKLADIHVGDMVGAFGDKDDKAKTLGAIAVMVIEKDQYEKARADFGKTWTAGAVQSIDETKITIKRPDNVVQTVVVDENTSFRKRRDSITLADIKVGDNVSARGALQSGNFLATELSVGGPGGGFRGGPRSGAASGGSGAAAQPANTPPTPNF